MTSRATIPVEQIIKDVKAHLHEAAEAVAKEVLKRAKASAAFADKSGKLRRSGKVKKSKFEEDQWIVIFSAPHAHLVEHGHDLVRGQDGRVLGHVGAKEFLGPAARSVREEIEGIVTREVGAVRIEVGRG